MKTKVYLFCARLCFSCRPVVIAYRRQDGQSFLDALVRTFTPIGGVPGRVIFDNGSVAVKSGHGKKAKPREGYAALAAHYGFEAVFCNPAEGHEKGLVEGLVGWARRNVCVPVPRVSSLAELNEALAARCLAYEAHTVRGRNAPVGVLYAGEKAGLMPLPGKPFETADCVSVRASAFSTVRYQQNEYSVPVRYAGRDVSVKAYPEVIAVYFRGDLIASHERLTGRHDASYRLSDYLPLLERRPRSVPDAAPVRQNVPAEVLERIREGQPGRDEVVRILRAHAGEDPGTGIPDPVRVAPVDLREYDKLCAGKEGTDDKRNG